MLIDQIDNPNNLKELSIQQCEILASEIREIIIKKNSLVGGHLSSNLGVIELTIALHVVFDSPKDKLIYDTSHQCYTHKILTGRKDGFLDVKKFNTLTGYTNPGESEHDLFKYGHTSTSISMACGLAKARDLRGEKENIVAIIGDAALGGGQALEGLNYAGKELGSNLIVILNDNQMSIAENHGALYDHIKMLRDCEGKTANNVFTALGFEYFFEKNGNSIECLIKVLKKVKDVNHPILLHVCTVKGKGYETAEIYPEESHWVKPFDVNKGIRPNEIIGERYDKIVRDYLIEKMQVDNNVVALVAAVPNVLAFERNIREKIGKQYIDVGIMEEHAISMCGGIAKNGGKPVFATRSTFIQRTYDQISQEIGINSLPVTILLVNASIFAPTDMTHMGIFDIPMISNIPNIVFLAPTNKQEYLAMLDWSIEQTTYPVVIRAPRNGVHSTNRVVDTSYNILNQFELVKDGNEIAIIAVGDFFQMGEELVNKIKEERNTDATLINPRFISGIDTELLINLIENHKLVITLEDGILDGGFGQKIASFYAKSEMKVLNYGFKKGFFDYYETEKILQENRLSPELILEDIENSL